MLVNLTVPLQLSDAWFRPLFAFVIIRHSSREIVHVNVTRSPTDAWVAQQLREATPYDQAPRFLIRDNDGKFGSHFADAADGAGIDVVTIPPKSPNLNAICERFLGGLRRECLDHILILGEDHLRRVHTGRMGATLQRWPSTPGDRPTRPEPAKAARSHGAWWHDRGAPGAGRTPSRLPEGGVAAPGVI